MNQPPRSLNLPPQSKVEDELLLQLNARSRAVEPRHLYEPIADHFNLTLEQRTKSRSGSDPDWHYLVRQARRRLVENGWMADSADGFWSLTDDGRKREEWVAAGKPQKTPNLWDDDPADPA